MPQEKPHFNILALGYRDQGKTTLTNAITKVLKKQGQTVVQTIPQKENGVDISMTHNAFQTQKNDYTLVDCARHEHTLKYITTRSTPLHGGILVVSSADGYDVFRYHINQQLALFSYLRIPYVVIFLNLDYTKGDIDAESLEVMEMEIREGLERYNLAGEYSPIIRASALDALSGDKEAEAGILELLTSCDNHFYLNELPKPVNYTKFKSVLYLLSPEEGGRARNMPLRLEDQTLLKFDTTEQKGDRKTLTLYDRALTTDEQIFPSDHASMEVTLYRPVTLVNDQRFFMLSGSSVIGICRVTELISK